MSVYIILNNTCIPAYCRCIPPKGYHISDANDYAVSNITANLAYRGYLYPLCEKKSINFEVVSVEESYMFLMSMRTTLK